MAIPNEKDKHYKAEIVHTRNFLRTLGDYNKCQSMMEQHDEIGKLPYEFKMKFNWSCLYIMEAMRQKKDIGSNCLLDMNLIEKNSFNFHGKDKTDEMVKKI